MSDGTTAPSKTNGFDPKLVKGMTKRVETCLDKLESMKGKYMSECKAVRNDISDIYKEAKAKGIPTRPFKNYVKERELRGKIEDLRDNLEEDDQDSYDLIKQAMGELADLPLGAAALAKHPDAPKGGDALDEFEAAAPKH